MSLYPLTKGDVELEIKGVLQDGTDILNFVLSDTYAGSTVEYGPLAIKFKAKKTILDRLIQYRLLDERHDTGQRVIHLTLAGFICSNGFDSDKNVLEGIFNAVTSRYERTNGKGEITSKELSKSVWGNFETDENHKKIKFLVELFKTSTYIFGIAKTEDGVQTIRPDDRILNYSSFDWYISDCIKILNSQFQANTDKDTNNSKEVAYNIFKEDFKFEGAKVSGKEYKCFVIMPIGSPDRNLIEYRNNMAVFSKIIKPCVEASKYNIRCYHADDELFTESGDIQKQIFDSIQNDEIAIVDLRRQNPNVIYEMCMRHYSEKRTILICSNLKENFFHNERYRAFQYFVDGSSNQRFHTQVQSAIESIVKNPDKADNPVRDSLGGLDSKRGSGFENELTKSKKFSDDRVQTIKSENKDKKIFLLTATPIPLIDESVDTNDNKIQNILRQPEYYRPNGWNMGFINNGEQLKPTFDGIEKNYADGQSLRLFRNGYLEFFKPVDYHFSWAQGDEDYKKSPRFNAYAITEFPVSFLRLIKQLVQEFGLTTSYIVKMAFFHCGDYKLCSGHPKSHAHLFPHLIKETNLDGRIYEKVIKDINTSTDAEAHILIERLYNTFGFTTEAIPFFDEQKFFQIVN